MDAIHDKKKHLLDGKVFFDASFPHPFFFFILVRFSNLCPSPRLLIRRSYILFPFFFSLRRRVFLVRIVSVSMSMERSCDPSSTRSRRYDSFVSECIEWQSNMCFDTRRASVSRTGRSHPMFFHHHPNGFFLDTIRFLRVEETKTCDHQSYIDFEDACKIDGRGRTHQSMCMLSGSYDGERLDIPSIPRKVFCGIGNASPRVQKGRIRDDERSR